MQQSAIISKDTPVEAIADLLRTQRDALNKGQLLLASELAFRAQDYATAVMAMEGVVERAPLDAALHYRLAMCRMKAGHASAVVSLGQALACDPTLVPAYQTLIALAIQDGDYGSAVYHARMQARACGSTPDLVMQTAQLLIRDERIADAMQIVQRLNETDADATVHSLRLESTLANRLELKDAAFAAARRAVQIEPRDADSLLMLAQLHCQRDEFAEAITLLRTGLEHDSRNPRLYRLLSASLAKVGDDNAALATAISAVQLAPDQSEYWYHAGMLAHTLGFTPRAVDLLRKATQIQPDNSRLWTAYARLLLATGKADEAIEALDAAERIEPDDREIKTFRIHILSLDRDATDLDSDGERLIKPLPRTRYRRSPSTNAMVLAWRSAQVQFRVVGGLTARAINHRAVNSRFGLLSTLFEPLVQVLAVGVILGLFNHSRPPIGNFFFFFYATGLLPLYLFVHIINHTMNVFSNQDALLQVPIVKRLDLVISESLAELVICGSTTVLTFVGFEVLGLAPRADNQIQALFAYIAVFFLGFGFGLMGAVITDYFPGYPKLWGVLQRSLYFISGIVIVAEHMPVWARAYAVCNPLLLCVTWFRTGFFPQYYPPWLDKGYVLGFAFCVVVLGMVLERASRRHTRSF